MIKHWNPKKTRTIKVFENNVQKAINLLKHDTAQLIKEVKLKRYFESNGQKRRRKAKESLAKNRKKFF